MKIYITILFILVFNLCALGQVKKSTKTNGNRVEVVSITNDSGSKTAYKGKASNIIEKSFELYKKGVAFFADNKKASSRQSFDDALDLLVTADVINQEQPQITTFYEKLQDLIYLVEHNNSPPPKSIAEKGKSDQVSGFNEQKFEISPLDDLAKPKLSDAVLLGQKPAQSKDGKVAIVMKYFDENMNDPYSMRIVKWSFIEKVYLKSEPYWAVQVRFRAKNGFKRLRFE